MKGQRKRRRETTKIEDLFSKLTGHEIQASLPCYH
jgi:hypothetical protein